MKKGFYLCAALLSLAVVYGCGDDEDPVVPDLDSGVTQDDGGTPGTSDDNPGTSDDDPAVDHGPAGTLTKVRDIKFRTVKAGTFVHGAATHTVTKDFRLSECEITNAQYCDFLNACGVGADGKITDETIIAGDRLIKEKELIVESKTLLDGSFNWGCTYNSGSSRWEPVAGYGDYPVIAVSWYGARAFCLWLGGNLPTEAQWELACQGNTCTDATTWWCDNSDGHTHAVGQKQAGSNGLKDMLGNVGEWCLDGFFNELGTATEYEAAGSYSDYIAPYVGGGLCGLCCTRRLLGRPRFHLHACRARQSGGSVHGHRPWLPRLPPLVRFSSFLSSFS